MSDTSNVVGNPATAALVRTSPAGRRSAVRLTRRGTPKSIDWDQLQREFDAAHAAAMTPEPPG